MENSFADKFPEIAKQWHPTLNGDLKPTDVSVGSGRIAYWICPKNPEHIWPTRINSRGKGRGCPYCTGKRKFGYKYRTLAEAFPEVAIEWHPTKNGNLLPENIGEGSSKRVWWKCKTNPEHKWPAPISSRTTGGTLCPYCSGNKLTKENSFGGKYPELAKQWHPTKNKLKTPFDYFPSSKIKAWWICKDFPEHEWQAQLKSRIETSGECPVCARKKPPKLSSLSDYNKELAKEWHPLKNGDLTPDQFSAGSGKKVWWQCKNDPQHEWPSTIFNRATKGKGCPYCARTKAGTNSLTLLHPNLASEWHPTKNNLSPNEISPGSRRYVWWRCSINPEHEWEAYVFNRVRGDGNCPICAKVGKSFAEKYPEVANEWHPSKNSDVKPNEVPQSSQKKYWWLCSINPEHEWEATPQNRGANGSGCPHCYKEKQNQELRDYLVASAVANTEYFQTFMEGIKNVQNLQKLEPSHHTQRQILNRLLYANVVTLMETFLSDAITNIVIKDQALTERLVETTPRFIEAKFPLSSIYAHYKKMDKEVAEYLQNDVLYHNIWAVEKLYRNVLGIQFPQDLVSLNKIIMKRHDIVHRNGKTVEGKTIVISAEEVKSAIATVSEFVSFIEKQLHQKIRNQ
jgi:glutaredoxin